MNSRTPAAKRGQGAQLCRVQATGELPATPAAIDLARYVMTVVTGTTVQARTAQLRRTYIAQPTWPSGRGRWRILWTRQPEARAGRANVICLKAVQSLLPGSATPPTVADVRRTRAPFVGGNDRNTPLLPTSFAPTSGPHRRLAHGVVFAVSAPRICFSTAASTNAAIRFPGISCRCRRRP